MCYYYDFTVSLSSDMGPPNPKLLHKIILDHSTQTSLYPHFFFRQHGGQVHVFWVECWRQNLVQRSTEKELQNLDFTVTICWTTGEMFV